MRRREQFALLLVAMLTLGGCDSDPYGSTPDGSTLQVSDVSVDLDCSRAREVDGCDVDAFVSVANVGGEAVTVRACSVGPDRDRMFGPLTVNRGDGLEVASGESAIGRVAYLALFSYTYSRQDLEREAREKWVGECQTEDESISAPVPDPAEVGRDCAYDFYSFGPEELASRSDLSQFDPAAVAQARADLFGYWTPAELEQCESAYTDAYQAYQSAAASGWEEWRTEERWLHRWMSYYLCAFSIVDDFPGGSREVLQGDMSVEEAARRYSHEYDRESLRDPGYDGCLPGLKLGLRLRGTD